MVPQWDRRLRVINRQLKTHSYPICLSLSLSVYYLHTLLLLLLLTFHFIRSRSKILPQHFDLSSFYSSARTHFTCLNTRSASHLLLEVKTMETKDVVWWHHSQSQWVWHHGSCCLVSNTTTFRFLHFLSSTHVILDHVMKVWVSDRYRYQIADPRRKSCQMWSNLCQFEGLGCEKVKETLTYKN